MKKATLNLPYLELFNVIVPVAVQKSLNSNPRILRLHTKIVSYSAVKNSTTLGIYLMDNINRINLTDFQKSDYCGLQNNFVFTKSPLNSWGFLRDFKSKAGIYQFVLGSDSYIGSTKDLYNRCFLQHKNQAFTKTNKHRLFYNAVIENGWGKWTLNIICIIPNHTVVFAEKNPDIILTGKDLSILQDLTTYELTLAEQLNLDYYKPTFNGSLLANWSTYNVGSSGYIRKAESNTNLSLSFLNRKFTEDTKELHKKNNIGKTLSDLTKIKMSKSHGGVTVNLLDVNTNEIIVFKNKSLVAKELNISLRTVSRWINDGNTHTTLSLKYPKVKLMI